MTARLRVSSVLLAAGTLATGYALAGRWLWGAVFALLGMLWLLGQRRDWEMTASIMLFLFVVGGINGLSQGVAVPWLLVGLVAALSTWDLDHFARRLKKAEQIDKVRVLEQRHLRRLLVVDGISLLLAAAALTLQVEITFGLALLLGALAVLVVSQVVSFLRQARKSTAEHGESEGPEATQV